MKIFQSWTTSAHSVTKDRVTEVTEVCGRGTTKGAPAARVNTGVIYRLLLPGGRLGKIGRVVLERLI